MPLYSHSKLATYEACPLQYKLRYVEKTEVEAGESVEAFLGKRVHEALEKLYQDLKYSRLLSLDELLSFYGSQWDRNWNDSVAITKKELTPQNYKDTGARCISGYYKRYAPFDSGQVMGMELMIGFNLKDDGSCRVQGFIDRLDRTKDGAYEIHDYKTSGSLPLQSGLDTDRQLALYEVGIREKFPDAREVKLVWHYLLFDAEFTSLRTHEQLEDLKQEIIVLIAAIEGDREFKHRESGLCNWCDYQMYCPAKKHLTKAGALSPEEFMLDDGVSLVNRYVEVWKKSKEVDFEKDRLKASLAEYARRNDVQNIAGSGCSVKVSFKEREKLPEDGSPERTELEEIIKKAGLWDDVCRLDRKALMESLASGKMSHELVAKIKGRMTTEESASVSKPKFSEEGD